MASFDPVALDRACADMVNNAPAINGWIKEHSESIDKFKFIHPDTDWEAGLRYAQEIGLGNREYELLTV